MTFNIISNLFFIMHGVLKFFTAVLILFFTPLKKSKIYHLQTTVPQLIIRTNDLKVVLQMNIILNRSLQHNEKIMIFYMDSASNVTQRYIRAIRINDESIVAYCYWRKKVRTFKLDNILSAGPSNKRVGA